MPMCHDPALPMENPLITNAERIDLIAPPDVANGLLSERSEPL
jgi:hypothetical protein